MAERGKLRTSELTQTGSRVAVVAKREREEHSCSGESVRFPRCFKHDRQPRKARFFSPPSGIRDGGPTPPGTKLAVIATFSQVKAPSTVGTLHSGLASSAAAICINPMKRAALEAATPLQRTRTYIPKRKNTAAPTIPRHSAHLPLLKQQNFFTVCVAGPTNTGSAGRASCGLLNTFRLAFPFASK